MNQSDQINELMAALSKAQGQMSGAVKDSDNPFFKSKYADLSSVWEACRQPLSANGLAIVQTPNINEAGDMYLVTTLGHTSGQWMRSTLPVKLSATKEGRINELQLLGSALTYLRRFALAAMVGVAPSDDDDGNESGKSATYVSKPAPKQITQPVKTALPEEELAPTKDELLDILSECDPAYKKMIMKSLEDLKKPIEDLTSAKKIALMKAAKIKRDEFQQQMKDLANEK
jgi:hypothetical protein